LLIFVAGSVAGASFVFMITAATRGTMFILRKYTHKLNTEKDKLSTNSIGRRRGFGGVGAKKIVRKRRGFGVK
tara:strand:+ start:206 stop:424 length:219 start_codon:yes stop_codon:yes gene_type:complete